MTPAHKHHATPYLREAATADLINELLARYDEALFIGCKPHGGIASNGTGLPQDPVVDVNSKLDKATGMGGILATMLSRVLMSLRAKGQTCPATPWEGCAACGN